MVTMRRCGRVLVLLALLAAAAPACGSSGVQYVEHGEEQLFVKVPEGWSIHDEDAYFAAAAGTEGTTALELQRERERLWITTFSAVAGDVLEAIDPVGDTPAGYVYVKELSERERSDLSLDSLRSAGFPEVEGQPLNPYRVAAQQDDGPVELQAYDEVVIEDRGHGVRQRVAVDGLAEQTVVRDVTAIVDPASTRLYLLVVGCSAACYAANQDDIELVSDSFTLGELRR